MNVAGRETGLTVRGAMRRPVRKRLSLKGKTGNLESSNLLLLPSQPIEDVMPHETTVTKDKLIEDLKIVIADAEDLLRATASQAGEKISAAREKVQDSLDRARAGLGNIEDVVMDTGKQVARATDEYVQDNPWQAVGIAAAVGLVIGLLISKR
jgi:ElaB/YqjD/DUF883 family membrane-anchored ribosome-binding protein